MMCCEYQMQMKTQDFDLQQYSYDITSHTKVNAENKTLYTEEKSNTFWVSKWPSTLVDNAS